MFRDFIEKLAPDWQAFFKLELEYEYMQNLQKFLALRLAQNKTIYPKFADIFTAFELTSLASIKAVILGQDPYYRENQAEGLCFSVAEGIKIPASLRNIFKELKADLNIEVKKSGSLRAWANSGVFLLNSTLTVDAGIPASHQGQGWEIFTDRVLQKISQDCAPTAFILWGNWAQKKQPLIDTKKHLIIKGSHPSPLSAHRGFFSSKPFSKTNQFLLSKKRTPIKWHLVGE